MAFENVVIVSTRNGVSPVNGYRQDLSAGDVMGLSLSSMVGVSSVRWRLIGRPEYSSAGGAGPEPILLANASTSSFTVDSDVGSVGLDGTYDIEATINPGSPGEVRKTAILCRLSLLTIPGIGTTRALRKISGCESLEDTSVPTILQGWATQINRWLELVRTIASGGGVIETLAGAYSVGASAADQTLALDDSKGGGLVINASGGGFTGASALRINLPSSVPVVFARATPSLGLGTAAPAANVHVVAATPALRLERSGGAAIDIKNSSDTLVFAIGGTTLASMPSTGGIRADLGIGIGAAPATAAALAMGAGSTAPVSTSNTGRIRYNEVAQQWETSINGAAYVPFGAGTGAFFLMDGISTGSAQLSALTPPTTGAVEAVVKTVRDVFYLDRASTLTADGITVVTALGGGRWIRRGYADLFWITQPNWFIDPTNTSTTATDENTGVDGTHQLRTRAEFFRRIGTGVISTAFTVTIGPGDLAASDVYTSAVGTNVLTPINWVGVPTQIVSGTVTAYTARNGAGSQPTTMGIASIPSSWTASGLVDKVIEWTDGIGNFVRSIVVTDLGSLSGTPTAQLSPPISQSNTQDQVFINGGSRPLGGTTVKIYSLPSLGPVVLDSPFQTFKYLSSSRWWMKGGRTDLTNCYGIVSAFGGNLSVINCNVFPGADDGNHNITMGGGAALNIIGGKVSVVGTGTARFSGHTTVGTLRPEGNAVYNTAGQGAVPADLEIFNTSTTIPAFYFGNVEGGRIISGGFVYGNQPSVTDVVQFLARDGQLSLSNVPNVTGATTANFVRAAIVVAISGVATRQLDDVNNNKIIGPTGPQLTDNRSQTILHVGSAAGVGTSAVNWNDVLGAIGGSAIALTPGSVPFAGGTGALTQDNANFFWDATNIRLGIGTATPGNIVDITRTQAGPVTVKVANPGLTSTSDAVFNVANDGTAAAAFGITGKNWVEAGGSTVPNRAANMAFLTTTTNGPAPTLYLGSHGVITLQTGATQAERVKILTTGEVQLSSLAAGGMVKAAAGGQLGIGVAGTDFIAPPGGGLTAGSVVFGGASGNIAQDNAKFFWDDTNFRLGIGTNTPAAVVDIAINAAGFGPGVRVINNSTSTSTTSAELGSTNGTHAMHVGTMGLNSAAYSASQPNLTAGKVFLFAASTTGMYIGSPNTISMQTGSTQAERLGIDASGNVSMSSLAAGGMVKAAAATGQLGIGVSGTDYLAPATALTTGSVLFAGAAGAVAQDNANLFWDDTGNQLGIGTNAPGQALHVLKTGNFNTISLLQNLGTGALSQSQFSAHNGTGATAIGVTGTSFVAGGLEPNLGASSSYLRTSGASSTLYLGSFGVITLQTGATQAERVKVDVAGNVFMSSLSAGGVVVADPTTGKLGIGSSGGGGSGLGVVNTGGAAAFSLGTLASGVLEHVVTSGISAPTSIAMVAGQIPFGSVTNGLLAQDSNLFWDNTNKRLGIGTTTPLNEVDLVVNLNRAAAYVIQNASTGTGATAYFNAQAGGTLGAPTSSMSVGVTGPNFTGGPSVPNLTSSMAVVLTVTPGPNPTLYLGSFGVITLQTGATQAERVKILTTGEVRLTSLAAGGLVKAAGTTGQLGIGLVQTADITDLNVTMGKLEPIGPSKILGNDGPATQSPFDISVIAPLTMVPGSGQLTFATGFAPGSVIFQGASQIAQNNAKLFWSDSLLRLGVGTNSPFGILEARNDASSATQVFARNESAGAAAQAQFVATSSAGGGIGVVVGVAGSGFSATTNRPLVIANMPYVVPHFGSSNLYIGAPATLIFATGSTEATRLQILASGAINVSSLSAGGIVTAAATTGQLGVVSFTAGEIPFGAASGGGLSQDTTFVWDHGNQRLGVGLANPGGDIHAKRSTGNTFTTIAAETGGLTGLYGAAFAALNDTGTVGYFGATGSGYTAVGSIPNLGANTAFLYANNSNPLYLGATGVISLQTGATQAERLRVLATGEVVIRNKLVGGTTAGNSLVLQGTTDVAHTGNVVSNDPFGIGRSPGVIGGAPMFAIAGNVAVSSSAGATLGYVIMNASTVTVGGSTNITSTYGFNCVDIEPHVYSTSVIIGAGGSTPAAATLCIHGAPTISGGGSFAGGVGAVGLWVKSAGAVIEGDLRLPGGNIIADGSLVAAGIDVNTARNISSFFVGTLPAFAFQATMDVGPSNPRVGFFNTGPILQPTVGGSKGGNAALGSLLTQLANLGLIKDTTT